MKFLDDQGQVRGWDTLLRHMEHILEKGGEGCLALGSDFDGCRLPEFFDGIAGLDELYRQTAAYFGKPLADRIFYDNARAFLANFD